MKKSIQYLAFLGIFCMMSMGTLAHAAGLKIGTGGKSGNYFGMTNDMVGYCSEAVGAPITVKNTGGSVDNLLGMTSKKYTSGIVQTDVLNFYAKKMATKVNQKRMKIISSMHTETVHLLIPKNYQPKSQDTGFFSKFSGFFSKQSDKPLDVTILKNQVVGAWGGSRVSAEALSYFMGLNWQIVDVPEGKRQDPGVPVVVVGGQPYAPVEEILATGKYVLVGLDHAQIASRAPFYLKVSANYGTGADSKAVDTIGVNALFVGKAFNSDKRNAPSVKLAQCIKKSLPDLADDPDTNPNWTSVYEMSQTGVKTNWSYFE